MNAKQEMLDICEQLEDRIGTLYEPIARIRAILETHTLEPIDEREFDPTRCGFKWDEHYRIWSLGVWEIMRGHKSLWITNVDSDDELELPLWPTQPDGQRLLRLLGVLNG